MLGLLDPYIPSTEVSRRWRRRKMPEAFSSPLIPANAGIQIIKREVARLFYTYIVAGKRNGAISISMTDDLARRIHEHNTKIKEDLAECYGCDRLVWYKAQDTREAAFIRERQLKEWRRSWKLLLIEEANLAWSDLYETPNG